MWTRPCSIKVLEIDIYQLFVQMTQATSRQMFSRLFPHFGKEITIDRDKLIKLRCFTVSQIL